MMSRNVRELLVLIVAFSLLVTFTLAGTQAQQGTPPDDETKIKTFRILIQTMVANGANPGSEAEAKYRAGLASLRQQLRDLLVEKRGALKSKIRNLQPLAATPEIAQYVSALQSELTRVDAEVTDLDLVLGQSGTVPMKSSPTPTPSPSDAQKAFEAKVAKLVPEDQKAVAAPPEVAATVLPQSTCTEKGPTNQSASEFDTGICSIAILVSKQRDDQDIHLSSVKGALLPILIAKLLKTKGTESYVAFVTEAQEARVDQQVGSGSSSKGTTSLVVKGGVPYFFGLAVENGAATQSQSDTTITYRVNPAGLMNMFAKKGFITGFRQNQNDPFLKVLGKTSLGFSFDTSRGNQPGVFTGDKQQLSAFSARFEFINERDPRLKKYEKLWEEFVANEGVALAKQVWATTLVLNDWGTATTNESFNDPVLEAWLRQTNLNLATVDRNLTPLERINRIAKIIRERIDLLPINNVSDGTVAAITAFAKQFKEYTDKKNEILKRIAKGKIFTLEYTNTRGVNAPDLSNFNFIAATGTGARFDLTANGSFTFFNKLPLATATTPRPGRIRDFQFAAQVTKSFKLNDSQFDFWFSGRYERLMENASTTAGTVMPNTKGDIAVGQIGLNVPIKSLGIKFPISMTFANRTELIKEKTVRGNIGFTFNWDTLFAKLKPF